MEGKLSLWTLTLVGAWKVNASTWTLALGNTRAGKFIFLHFASNTGVEVLLGSLALGYTCAGENIILDFGAGGSVEGEGIALDFGAGEAFTCVVRRATSGPIFSFGDGRHIQTFSYSKTVRI